MKGDMHFVVWDGHSIQHTIRKASGDWAALGDVLVEAAAPTYWSDLTYGGAGYITHVSIAYCAETEELHLTASYTEKLNAYHTIRGNDGKWTKLTDVFDHLESVHGPLKYTPHLSPVGSNPLNQGGVLMAA